MGQQVSAVAVKVFGHSVKPPHHVQGQIDGIEFNVRDRVQQRGTAFGWLNLTTGALLLPASLAGIALGTLAFGVMSDRMVKGAVGLIAVVFAADRLLRKPKAEAHTAPLPRLARLCGVGAGFTSTLAHAGAPPVMIYLLSRRQPRETFVATSVFFFAVINLAKLPPD